MDKVKLDGVGPVDNRLASPLCPKKEEKSDMWHMTRDRWEEVNLLPTFHLPSSYGLGVILFWRYFHNGWMSDLINESVTNVLVEQIRILRVC